MRSVLHYGAFLITAAMVAAALYMLLRRLSALPQVSAIPGAEEAPVVAPTLATEAQLPTQPEFAPAPERAAEPQQMATPAEAPAQPGRGAADKQLIAQLSDMGAEAPGAFAQQLSGWLSPPEDEE